MTAEEVVEAGEPERREHKAPGLGCAGCGDCCERISIGTPMADLRAELSGAVNSAGWRSRGYKPVGRSGGSAAEAAFIARHWHPTGEVRRDSPTSPAKQVLSCDVFDPVERRCTAHAERPAVCRDYPFYGRPPAAAMREPHCSYYLDLPPAQRPEGSRPLIPLAVLGASSAPAGGRCGPRTAPPA